MTPTESRARLVDDLVAANAILADRGIVDGFGHVSARSPDDPSRFLMSRSKAPALVRADDILDHDLSGQPDHADARPYLERFIHSSLYAARADVMAIVHSHSAGMVSFACVPAVELRPVYHMSAFLDRGVARFEIRDFAGDTSDMLVRTAELGDALATCLGHRPLALMRGHGSTVVGASIQQVVYRAIYAETNAKLQMDALRLGAPSYLNTGEARAAEAANDTQIGRAWDLWRRAAE